VRRVEVQRTHSMRFHVRIFVKGAADFENAVCGWFTEGLNTVDLK
jgi:hypothetical protein